MGLSGQPITFTENITLSPLQKYQRFGIFPWKFILHILLTVLCTYEALKIVSIEDKHTRIQEQVFSQIYLKSSEGSTDFAYYNLADFTDTFFQIFSETQILNQTLLQYSNISDIYYKLDVYYSEMNPIQFPTVIYQGSDANFLKKLAKIPLHAGQYAQMKNFIEQVQEMHLQIRNIITYTQANEKKEMQSCLNWTVHIAYNFESFANVESQLTGQSFTCSINDQISYDESIFMIHIGVMILSMLSLLLTWKQIYEISTAYMIDKSFTANNKHDHDECILKPNVDWRKSWQDLDFSEKIKFFDFWFIITAAANFFQMFGALVAILDSIIDRNYLIFQHKAILIGFGVMFIWISILQYLKTNNNLNIMSATLSKSSGNLFMFLLGVMPFFLGFVFLGQTIFWKYNKFDDTSSSVITLFSLINGDIVSDTFLETWAEGLVGQLYLILFMILFYTAVQNVFVTIIMEGYEESLKEKQYKEKMEQKTKSLQQDQESDSIIQEIQQDIIDFDNQQINKIMANGKKIDQIFAKFCELSEKINKINISEREKQYLNNLVQDNLESAYRTINSTIKNNKQQK